MHNRRILMILVIWHEDRGSLTKPFLCTPESGETSLLKGRWRKLRYLDCLDLVIAVQIISAACVLHNYCLLHDHFDVGYFLPDHADGGEFGGSEQQEPLKIQQKISPGWCFSFFSSSFCLKMYLYRKEKLLIIHSWKWKGLKRGN